MDTIYIHEHYPHHMGAMSADFTITLEELKSLKDVDFEDGYDDNEEALEKCLEARADANIYFVYEFINEILLNSKRFTKLIRKLEKKGKATLIAEEGVWGFSTKSAGHAEKAALVKEAKLCAGI